MRTWGYVALVGGLTLAALGIIADAASLGGTPGFGFAQGGALIVGILLIIGGSYLIVRSGPETAQ